MLRNEKVPKSCFSMSSLPATPVRFTARVSGGRTIMLRNEKVPKSCFFMSSLPATPVRFTARVSGIWRQDFGSQDGIA